MRIDEAPPSLAVRFGMGTVLTHGPEKVLGASMRLGGVRILGLRISVSFSTNLPVATKEILGGGSVAGVAS